MVDYVLQETSYVGLVPLDTVEAPKDFETVAAVPIVIEMVIAAVVTLITVVVTAVELAAVFAMVPNIIADSKHVGRYETALAEIELVSFVGAISSEDSQGLVPADGGIAAHRLIVDSDSPIDAAARYQIA
ncbi:MAG TPA: hypothetical protein VNK23_16795 [Candidatus Dormibacteraeota bacterium]|nr:hypothetical protein [Candidatus Dormibacteraeota bacterium]